MAELVDARGLESRVERRSGSTPDKPNMTTVKEAVLEEAKKFGITPKDEDIEFIVWEKTGYPSFWPDQSKTPEENFRQQLRDYFSSLKKDHL